MDSDRVGKLLGWIMAAVILVIGVIIFTTFFITTVTQCDKELQSEMTCQENQILKHNVSTLEKTVTQLTDMNAKLKNALNTQQDAAQTSIKKLNEEIQKCNENLLGSNNEMKETKEKLQKEVEKYKDLLAKSTATKLQGYQVALIPSIILTTFLTCLLG